MTTRKTTTKKRTPRKPKTRPIEGIDTARLEKGRNIEHKVKGE